MITGKNYDDLMRLLMEEVEVAQTGFDTAADPQFATNKQLIGLIANIRRTMSSAEKDPTKAERELGQRLRAAENQLHRVEYPPSPLKAKQKNQRNFPEPRTREQINDVRMARGHARLAAIRQRQQQMRHAALDNGLE